MTAPQVSSATRHRSLDPCASRENLRDRDRWAAFRLDGRHRRGRIEARGTMIVEAQRHDTRADLGDSIPLGSGQCTINQVVWQCGHQCGSAGSGNRTSLVQARCAPDTPPLGGAKGPVTDGEGDRLRAGREPAAAAEQQHGTEQCESVRGVRGEGPSRETTHVFWCHGTCGGEAKEILEMSRVTSVGVGTNTGPKTRSAKPLNSD